MNRMPVSRREWLERTCGGMGGGLLAAMGADAAAGNAAAVDGAPPVASNDPAENATGYRSPLAAKAPHFAPRAKRVIFLFMSGGPSHVDLLDDKPELRRLDGKPVPAEARQAIGADKARSGLLFGSPWKFARHGQSGLAISELLPHLAGQADKLCVVNSLHCDSPAHIAACTQMHTGQTNFQRPSLGAWTLFGLGTDNPSLPGFVALGDLGRGGGPINLGSSFLPAAYQATTIGDGPSGPTIAHLDRGPTSESLQRRQIDALAKLTGELERRTGADARLDGVLQSFELAFRMQSVAPEVLDLKRETKRALESYGIGVGKKTHAFGTHCLLARRMAEAGVRFIEVGGGRWDHHARIDAELPEACATVDRPIAALLADLERLGMLDETLVVWGGEFGRTPVGTRNGRDHNRYGFTMWLAGGGVRGGMRYGRTDDFGFAAVEDPVHVHDLHATILHLVGLDHRRLTYRYGGRDFRLTDVHGRVVEAILA